MREAREVAVAAASGPVVTASPKVQIQLSPTSSSNKEGGGGSSTFAELQRCGGGLPDSNAPARSDKKSGGAHSKDSVAVSSHRRYHSGESFARFGSKDDISRRGLLEISTVYGD